ncbi:GTPase RsgA [Cryptosporangium phraense]|uniref:GTPase RsgA n=1 Tax=Cryptosporangium phraense TaxID=2593070 RepID=UPI0014793083|nr:GTPase RsgA [Cryptosporangium phraense]
MTPVPGRVAGIDDSGCRCLTAAGPVLALPGPDVVPVVGDWGLLTGDDLVAVLPRASAVRHGRGPDDVRGEVLAANADVVLVVVAFADGLTPEPIERLLGLAAASGAAPVLVLSQVDRAPDGPRLRSVLADLAVLAEGCPGTPVVGVSTVPGHPGEAGLARLRRLLPVATTAAVIGAPGAGKTTLVDVLGGRNIEAGHPDGGRAGAGHPGGGRPGGGLVPLPGGGVLLDTPGCPAGGPGGGADWLAERYLIRSRAASRARWRAGPRGRRGLAGGA